MIKFEKKKENNSEDIFDFLKAKKEKRKQAKERKKVIKTFPELFQCKKEEAKVHLFYFCN